MFVNMKIGMKLGLGFGFVIRLTMAFFKVQNADAKWVRP
jgi:hypothetical protein